MKNLRDLFEHQIKDLYSAEDQLLDALKEMAENAKNQELRDTFNHHLKETREHKKRLEKVAQELDFKPTGETCKAMQGLIKEAKDFLKEDTSDEVINAGLIADAQRIEHYEIAGYGTVCTYAEELGLHEQAKILKETLEEEKGADEKLKSLAQQRINEKAKS